MLKENKMQKSDKKLFIHFLIISFGLTWAIAALLMAFYDPIIAVFGELTVFNPLFVLAVYSPGIAAVYLVWLLQRKYTPFKASIVLGIIWMVWHIPAFLIAGTAQSSWSFLPYFIGGVAISIIFTAFYNSSRGSLLIAFLLHFQLNNPIWPNAQPWENYLIALIAILVVVISRKQMFSSGHKETEIFEEA